MSPAPRHPGWVGGLLRDWQSGAQKVIPARYGMAKQGAPRGWSALAQHVGAHRRFASRWGAQPAMPPVCTPEGARPPCRWRSATGNWRAEHAERRQSCWPPPGSLPHISPPSCELRKRWH